MAIFMPANRIQEVPPERVIWQSVGGHDICLAGFAPRLKEDKIGKHAAKGF